MTEEALSQNPLLDIGELGDTPVSPATGISALAMNFAMKWLDVSVIKDGAMYQQKKLEGANIHGIDLRDVFHVARKFEAWLIGAPNRLTELMLDEELCNRLLADVSEAGRADISPPDDGAVVADAQEGQTP